MGRMIDADALKKNVLDLPNCYNGFSDTYDKACIIGVIDEQPTIEERKTGKWKKVSASRYVTRASYAYKCSACGDIYWLYSNFCPNCGADMRGNHHETT